jgi:small subunit ribosomal protein S19
MSRSSKKGPSIDNRLVNKIIKSKSSGSKDTIKTWSRSCMIIPDFIGMTIHVHDGRRFVPVYVSEGMVGHRLGEFAITRTFRLHSGQRKAGVKK